MTSATVLGWGNGFVTDQGEADEPGAVVVDQLLAAEECFELVEVQVRGRPEPQLALVLNTDVVGAARGALLG